MEVFFVSFFVLWILFSTAYYLRDLLAILFILWGFYSAFANWSSTPWYVQAFIAGPILIITLPRFFRNKKTSIPKAEIEADEEIEQLNNIKLLDEAIKEKEEEIELLDRAKQLEEAIKAKEEEIELLREEQENLMGH